MNSHAAPQQKYYIVNNPTLLRRLVQEARKHSDRSVQIKMFTAARSLRKEKV